MSHIRKNPPGVGDRRISEMSSVVERDKSETNTCPEPFQPIPPNWMPLGLVLRRIICQMGNVGMEGGGQ